MSQRFDPAAKLAMDGAAQLQQLQRDAATRLQQSLAESNRKATLWFIGLGLVGIVFIFTLLEMLRARSRSSWMAWCSSPRAWPKATSPAR